MKAVSHWIGPNYNVDLPHTHASGTDGPTEPIYYRVPCTARKEKCLSTILLNHGLRWPPPEQFARDR